MQAQTLIANFPTADKPAYVYFVRIGKFIKIGFTTNLRGRLKGFRGASAEPIEILLIILGGRELEQRLHALFCEDRISKQISECNYQKIVAERIRLRDKAQRKYECCPEKRERPRRR